MNRMSEINKKAFFLLILAIFASVFCLDCGLVFAYTPPAATVPTCTAGGPTPCTDYFGVANYANSPLPAGTITGFTVTDGGSGYTAPTVIITDPACSATATATVTGGMVTAVTLATGGSGCIAPQVMITDATGTGALASATIGAPFTGGIHKFVDTLPGLCGVFTNDLGQCIPVAAPDTATFPGSDYYSIGLNDFTLKMHTGLPATTRLRGYVQLNAGGTPVTSYQYLGPMIVAVKDRPVRLKFTNMLPTGNAGDLFLPVDTTYMGAGMGPDGTYYSQNRAVVHLHGGHTPWISDGTPRQWITPANETDVSYPKGDSFQNVPDMVNGSGVPCADPTGAACFTPTPTDGLATYYYTNQQSGRLLFYHDHSYGMTRLNVYAGEAAPYLIVDPAQEAALKNATVPGTIPNTTVSGTADLSTADLTHLVPLVIQEKTFVPDPATQLKAEDPTWNTTLYGGLGNLWFPHVYMTNQDPADPLSMNAFGRWDYGPWFWPFQTSLTAATPNTAVTIPCVSSAYPGVTVQCPIIPNPSGTPEAFMDTPVVNGTAYPVLHVAPAAYRFQILSAGNDRSLNLQLYYGATAAGTVCKGAAASSASCTEVNMVAAAPPTATSVLQLCSTVTQVTNPSLGVGLAIAALDATGNPLNGTGLQANCWPTTWPTDGRAGGVPDPTTAGPAFVEIGNESGPLPSPVVIPSTPINYEYNRRSITVTNVSSHGLLLGPAERADVVVDFSSVPAGSTLIVYNDAPAPNPGFDTRLDYYTGDPDQTGTGGAPTTQPGYGPNTRTIMQIVVDQTAPNTVPFSLPALQAAFTSTPTTQGVFAASQNPPIVPESTYDSAYNANYADVYSKIQDYALTYFNGGPLPGIYLTAGGTGYSATPTVTISAPTCTPGPTCVTATATATVTGGVITGITLTNAGNGYTAAPTIDITDPTGTGASATAAQQMESKTIQELFTSDYGRMNATLGTELPLTNFLTQTTIPLGYVDPPTEIFREGETQLWRITHNGVDTHFIHFHLFDVQVINRVGWDGTVRPPDENETGWKDTVRMNPLEDIVVAVRPIRPTVPWPLPDSIRALDTTMPLGTSAQFTGVDPYTGNAMTVTNQMMNFGWEYVWHCHILGHEENDMMRPMIFQVAPEAPSSLLAAIAATGVNLTWRDNSASASQTAAPGSGFTLQRATDGLFTLNVQNFTVPPAASAGYGSTASYLDTTAAGGTTYYYRVQAFTPNGVSTWSNVAPTATVPIASAVPTSLVFGSQPVNTTSTAQTVTLYNIGVTTLTINSIGITGTNAADFAQTSACGASLAAGANCTISVTFSPAAMGARTASVSVSSNDPAHPTLTVSLSGTGAMPVAGVAPAALTFGSQMLNTTSAAQTVTLSNAGNTALTISSIVITGANAADFAQTNTCGATLAAGASCTIGVTFTPGAAGARSASVSVGSNDPVHPTLTVSLAGTGTVPIAGVSPATLTFGNQTLNTTSGIQTATLSNTGTAPLTINSIGIIGTNPGDFVQTNTCGATLAAGANCLINVTFTPTALGTRTASVTISSNDPVHPALTASLSGTCNMPIAGVSTATSPSITGVAPAALSFGSQLINTTSAAQILTLSNTGNVALTINSIGITGTNPGDFGKTTTCTGSLAAGANCAISVTFKPTATGARAASLTISSSDPVNPTLAVSLNGMGTAVKLSAAALSFGNQLVNTTSTAQTVTLTNVGGTALAMAGISITGANAGDFTNGFSTTCTSSLAAGKSCAISVRFTPLAVGPMVAAISVSDSDPASPQTVSLSGTGVMPVAAVSPTSLTFSSALNVTSAAQTVTISNTGTAPLKINTISLGGTNPSQFLLGASTCGTLPASLPAGSSCTVRVKFSPTNVGTGTKSALLNVGVAAPATSQSVTLTGTVIAPVLTLSPTSLNFGNQAVNTASAPQTVTVSNTGAATMTINGISMGGTNPGQFLQTNNCGPFPATLAAGANCTVSVTFVPKSTGTKSATLTVSVASPATSRSVTLSGTGQ